MKQAREMSPEELWRVLQAGRRGPGTLERWALYCGALLGPGTVVAAWVPSEQLGPVDPRLLGFGLVLTLLLGILCIQALRATRARREWWRQVLRYGREQSPQAVLHVRLHSRSVDTRPGLEYGGRTLGAFHFVSVRLEGGPEETLQYGSAREAKRVARALERLAPSVRLTVEERPAVPLTGPSLGGLFAAAGLLLVAFGLDFARESWKQLGPDAPTDRARYSSLEELEPQRHAQSSQGAHTGVLVYGRLGPHPVFPSGPLLWEEQRFVRDPVAPTALSRWEVTERQIIPVLVMVRDGIVSLTRGDYALHEAPVVSQSGERRRRGFKVTDPVRVQCARLSPGESERELLCEPEAMYDNPPEPPRRGELTLGVLMALLMVPVGLRLLWEARHTPWRNKPPAPPSPGG